MDFYGYRRRFTGAPRLCLQIELMSEHVNIAAITNMPILTLRSKQIPAMDVLYAQLAAKPQRVRRSLNAGLGTNRSVNAQIVALEQGC